MPREKTPTGAAPLRGLEGVPGLPGAPQDDAGLTRCGARGGFLPRHDEDLREPLVRRQGSQVCMCEARAENALSASERLGKAEGSSEAARAMSRAHPLG